MDSKSSKSYVPANVDVNSLLTRLVSREYNGVEIDVRLWTVHARAQVSGVEFTSGQPMTGVRRFHEKMLRCGSVITLVRGSRSLYAWVIRFLSFDRIHVAHVRWLPEPEHPSGNPLLCRLNTRRPPPPEPCIVPLVDVDPSPVALLHEQTHVYMMRMNGVNTIPPE